MSLFSSLFLVSGLLYIAAAAPTLLPRSMSCPASNNTVFAAGSHNYTVECETDRDAGDMPAPNGQYADSLESCIAQCEARAGCVLVNYATGPQACYLKSTVGSTKADRGVVGALLLASPSPAATVPVESVTLTPSATPTSVPGKRGLAYNDPAMTQFFGGSGSHVTWMYDWTATPLNSPNSALKYIPMLWSNGANHVAAWKANADAGIAGGADALLGFNEPDHSEQANMAVSTAVSDWKTNMEPFHGKARLVSPAVTNGPPPMGLAYLTDFISQCTGCHIDACAIHWYDSATNIEYFQAYIPQARDACGGKPIWITEFGVTGTEEQVVTFLQTVLPWLDGLEYVERYAYFWAAPSGNGQFLVNNDGTGVSTIGQVFDGYS